MRHYDLLWWQKMRSGPAVEGACGLNEGTDFWYF